MVHSSSKTTNLSQNPRLIRILIVDDQKVIRAKLQEILATSKNLTVIGTANDGDKAITLIETLKPDLVILDIEMPKMNGIEVSTIISQRFPESKILVLSSHAQEEYIQQAISAGAYGYILKHDIPEEDLISAINFIHQGYSLFGSKLLKKFALVTKKSQVTPKKINLQEKFSSPQITPKDVVQLVETKSPSFRQNTHHKPSNKFRYQTSIVKSDKTHITTKLPSINTEEFLPSIDKWLTWGSLSIVSALILAIPATSVLKYKTTVKTQATVRPAGELRLVQATTEGQIAEILIEQGQTVNQGDVIATIDSSRFQTRKKQLAKAIAQQRVQLAQFNTQMSILDSQIIAETEGNNSEILAAEAELTGNLRDLDDRDIETNTKLEEAEAQLKATEATLKAAQSKVSRYRSVASEGALSQEQLSEAELEVRQQEQKIVAGHAAVKRAMGALNPSNAKIEVAKQRIRQLNKSELANMARLNREKEALVQQRLEISKQLEQDIEELNQVNMDFKQTNLTATATGTVSKLNLRNPGQTVQSGQEIAQIIPGNVPLEIKAAVSPQDIGKLEVKQKVQMRVSACPYPDYGTLHGAIIKVARDTSKPEDNTAKSSSNNQQSSPAFYEVTVSPENPTFGRGQDVCRLQLGMEGRIDIITREESVLKFILRKTKLISNF